MICPNCGGGTKITEGRRKGSISYRRHKCLKCGFVLYTKAEMKEEVVSEEAWMEIRRYHTEYARMKARSKKNEMS